MSEFTLSPILGDIAGLGTATKPFRVNNGQLEVEDGSDNYKPVIECVDNLGYTGVFDSTGDEKPVSPNFVKEYLQVLGIAGPTGCDSILNRFIMGKSIGGATGPQGATFPCIGFIGNYVDPGVSGTWYDYNARYYYVIANQRSQLQDYTSDSFLRDDSTGIDKRIDLINDAIGATGTSGTMLFYEAQMKKLNNFLIEGSAEHLTPTNHISDYVSLDHSVWYEGQGDPILISLNNIYYKYNQLMYKDDAGIIEDPEDTDDEQFTPIGTEVHELKYGFYEIPDMYGRKAVSGSIVELFLEYKFTNIKYLQRVLLVVDPNYDGIPQIVKVQRPGTNSLAFNIEISTDCIVAYPNDVTDYRIKDARVLI